MTPLVQKIVVDSSGVKRGYGEAWKETKQYSTRSKREVDGFTGDAERKMSRSSKRIGGMWSGLGATMKTAMVGAITSIGVAIVTTLAKATKAAAQFKAEMAQVATLTGRDDFLGLSAGVLDLAKRLPVALSDLTTGLYQAVSAGIEAGKAVQFLDVAARAAVGGNATVTQSVQGLTAALNGFQIDAADAADVADTLFVGVKRGVTTFDELSSQLGNVSGLASEANITLEETVAATAALTLTTNDTARATTQLRGIIQKIIKPTQQGQEALDAMGLTFDKNTIAEKGFRTALNELVSASQRTGIGLGQIFEDVEGLTGALTLAGTQSDGFGSILGDMATKAGSSADAYAEMKDEATTLWSTLKQNLNVRLIELGERVLPAVNTSLQHTIDLMRAFDTPSERLLNTLSGMSNVDPELLADLKIRVQEESLQRELDRVNEVLRGRTEIETNLRLDTSGLLNRVVGDVSVISASTSLGDLNRMRDELSRSLIGLSATDTSGFGARQRNNFNDLIRRHERELAKIDEIVRARREQALIEEQITALRTASGSIAPSGGGNEDPPAVVRARSIAAEIEGLQERQQALADTGVQSQELIDTNVRLAQLEQEKNDLLKAGVEEWERQVEAARQLGITSGMSGPAGMGPSILGIPDFLKSRSEYSALALPSEEDLRQLRLDPKFQKEYEEWAANISGANNDLEDAGKAMRNLATAGRSVLRVADIFGDLSDEVRRAADGILDTLDNIGALRDMRSSPDATFADKLIPGAGIAAGVLSTVSGLAGMFGSGQDDIEEAVRENTRRIEKSIEEMADAMRFGEGLSGDQVSGIASALLAAGGAVNASSWDDESLAANVGPIQQRFRDLFDLLDDAGLDTEGFRNMLPNGLLESSQSEADFNRNMQAMLEYLGSVRALVAPLIGSHGLFNPNTVDGVIGRSRLMQSLGGSGSDQVFTEMVNGLLGIEGISEQMVGFLEEILGVSDPASTAGKEAVRALIEQLVGNIDSGAFGFGSLSPSEVDDILNALSGFSSSDGAGGDDYNRSVQIQRAITEITANELVAIAEGSYMQDARRNELLEEIAMILNQAGGAFRPIGRPPGLSTVDVSTPGGATVFNNTLNAEPNEENIQRWMSSFEESLRRMQRGRTYA